MAASASDLFLDVTPGFATTIGAGGVASGATTTIPLTSVSGLSTTTGIELVINRVDSQGAATNNSETVRGTISGSNLINAVRGVEGTAQAWDAGIVVEYLVTADIQNRMVDGITANHGQDGLHSATDFNGTEVTIDADADTTMTADTDDQIDWKLGGSDRFRMKTSDLDMVTATANLQVAGTDPKRGLYVPAFGMFPATTSGCAAVAQVESTTNKVNYKTLDFDQSSDEYACFNIPAPSWWDLGTVTAEFHWTAASGSGTVTWAIQGLAVSEGDAIDAAYGTAVSVTDTLTTAEDEHLTSDTSAITIAGTPAKDDNLFFRIYRDVSEDNLNADARLIGVTIRFTMGQYTDE